MLSGAGVLSAFCRIVFVDSEVVFKLLGAWISNSSTSFIQGNAVGKIKSSFFKFQT